MDPNILLGALVSGIVSLGTIAVAYGKLRRDHAVDKRELVSDKNEEQAALVSANAEAWNKLAKSQGALLEATDKRVDAMQKQIDDCQRDRERLYLDLVEERSERRIALAELKRELETVSVRIPERRTEDKGRGEREDQPKEERRAAASGQ